jgi:hypothetical protein
MAVYLGFCFEECLESWWTKTTDFHFITKFYPKKDVLVIFQNIPWIGRVSSREVFFKSLKL